jgi:hypothetical protein
MKNEKRSEFGVRNSEFGIEANPKTGNHEIRQIRETGFLQKETKGTKQNSRKRTQRTQRLGFVFFAIFVAESLVLWQRRPQQVVWAKSAGRVGQS